MRFFLKLCGFGLLLLVLIAFAIGAFLDSGARKAVEKGATYALGVPTAVDSVTIRPFRGGVALSSLEVANPPGFAAQPFLSMGDASMEVTMSSLLDDVVEVKSFTLADLHLRLEGRGTKSNYGAILDNLARLDSGTPDKGTPEPKQGASKRFIVRDLTIRNVKVDADYALDSAIGQLASGAASVTLPDIHLTNLGTGEGLTLAQLTSKILRALLEEAGSGNIPGLSADLAKDLRKNLADLEAQAKDLGKQLEDKAKDLGRELESGAKGALDGLLKKKD